MINAVDCSSKYSVRIVVGSSSMENKSIVLVGVINAVDCSSKYSVRIVVGRSSRDNKSGVGVINADTNDSSTVLDKKSFRTVLGNSSMKESGMGVVDSVNSIVSGITVLIGSSTVYSGMLEVV